MGGGGGIGQSSFGHSSGERKLATVAFQGNIFLFPFFLLLFYSPINGGGGGHGPLVHLSYSSNSGAAKICQRGQSEGRVWEGDFSKFVYETGIFLHIRYHYGVVYVLA